MTPEMNLDNNGKMDWFFNQWVYGTQVPAYKFEYNVSSDGMLNGKITQSGVSDDFAMLVPIYVDMGKGWATWLSSNDRVIHRLRSKISNCHRYRNAWRLCDERRAGDEYREQQVKQYSNTKARGKSETVYANRALQIL